MSLSNFLTYFKNIFHLNLSYLLAIYCKTSGLSGYNYVNEKFRDRDLGSKRPMQRIKGATQFQKRNDKGTYIHIINNFLIFSLKTIFSKVEKL